MINTRYKISSFDHVPKLIKLIHMNFMLLLLLTYLLTAIEFSQGGSSPYSSTDITNKNKYT